MSAARRLAADVLLRVEQGGAFANLALDSALRAAGRIEPREAALTTELTYGTLRWQLQLDRAIGQFSDKNITELDLPVRIVLRLCAFELLHHPTVPARAAVHEAVELCKELRAGRASGYVNAVLRKLSEARTPAPLPSREVDPIGYLAAKYSHPRWMVERWTSWLGAEQAEKLCAANQQIAANTLRVNLAAGTVEAAEAALLQANVQTTRGRYSPAALLLAPGTPPALDLEGHERGLVQSQDEGAQLVSLFAAPGAGARVLDACAAPGGKACHLAELVGPAGSVLAVDLHERKAEIIAEAAARLGVTNLRALAADATLPLPAGAGAPEGGFDLVLLDAPCSGLGTLRRHPEVKLRRTPEDVDRLAQLQRRLLDQVAHSVRKGGLLVYAVCTLLPEECDEQVTRFLAARPDFREEPAPAGFALPPAQLDCLDDKGRLRTLPGQTGTDGFFAVRMRRALD